MSDPVKRERQTVTATDVGTVRAEDVAAAPKAPRTDQLRRELEAEQAKLREEMKPFREFYEAHVNDPEYLEACRKIKEISAKLGPVDNELAALARAAGARVIKAEPGEYKSE